MGEQDGEGVALAIMAKAPSPGFAKTRLIPALGEAGAAQLAERLLLRTLQASRAAGLAQVALFMTPPRSAPVWQSLVLPEDIHLFDQCEGDLGVRLVDAARRLLAGHQGVILSGTDCVEVSPALFREAAEQLRHHDAVLYPTADGGYALLGFKRLHPSLFEEMPWSSDQVAALTLARVRALGWSLFVGECLHDVDEPEDLPRLERRLSVEVAP